MLQELTAEQELFSNVVQTLVEAPFSIHAQCQTIDIAQSNIHLPTAKFDLMVNSLPTLMSASTATPASTSAPASTSVLASILPPASTSSTCKALSGIVLILDGQSEESNKTDKTLNLHALIMFSVF